MLKEHAEVQEASLIAEESLVEVLRARASAAEKHGTLAEQLAAHESAVAATQTKRVVSIRVLSSFSTPTLVPTLMNLLSDHHRRRS